VATLGPGAPFPRLSLREANGDPAPVPPRETLFAVFKTTCPTCELAWPILERVRRAGEGGLDVIAVSQDDPGRTAEFNRRLGAGFRTLYDPEPWPASDRLGVTNVPTLFLVGEDGRVRDTIIGFEREKMQALAARGSRLAGRPAAEIFDHSDREVPALKAG
jgi:thiol-disulfide isomerase/thioredoxin